MSIMKIRMITVDKMGAHVQDGRVHEEHSWPCASISTYGAHEQPLCTIFEPLPLCTTEEKTRRQTSACTQALGLHKCS
eukprot:scaffold299678_cov21-Tisochrysis_lutea.AAC.1